MRIKTIALAIVLTLTLLTGVVRAQNEYEMVQFTVGIGGICTGDDYSLRGTVGQASVATLSGDGYTVTGGYWTGGASSDTIGVLYLPMIER